jgi:hypothetical protein
MMISTGHPDTRLPILKQKSLNWTVQIFELDKPSISLIDGLDDSKFHYLYVCTKK